LEGFNCLVETLGLSMHVRACGGWDTHSCMPVLSDKPNNEPLERLQQEFAELVNSIATSAADRANPDPTGFRDRLSALAQRLLRRTCDVVAHLVEPSAAGASGRTHSPIEPMLPRGVYYELAMECAKACREDRRELAHGIARVFGRDIGWTQSQTNESLSRAQLAFSPRFRLPQHIRNSVLVPLRDLLQVPAAAPLIGPWAELEAHQKKVVRQDCCIGGGEGVGEGREGGREKRRRTGSNVPFRSPSATLRLPTEASPRTHAHTLLFLCRSARLSQSDTHPRPSPWPQSVHYVSPPPFIYCHRFRGNVLLPTYP